MQPTITYQPQLEPQKKRHVLLKIIISIVVVAIIAGITFFVARSMQQVSRENEVKTELIKQNKLIKASAKNSVYPSSLPDGVKTTSTVIIDATISSTGTAYCIAGTSKSDAKVIYHMDAATPDQEPAKGSCSDGATVAPLTPSNLAVGSVSAGAISLMWNTAPYAASYTVQCATDKNFISELVSRTTSDTKLLVDKLSGGILYYCRVSAGNSIGQSGWSSTVDGLTNPVSLVPTELKATTVSSSQLRYSWKAVPGASSYVVEYSKDINFENDVTRIPTKLTSGDVTGLKPYTEYYFHVKAITPQFDSDHASFSELVIGRTAK